MSQSRSRDPMPSSFWAMEVGRRGLQCRLLRIESGIYASEFKIGGSGVRILPANSHVLSI